MRQYLRFIRSRGVMEVLPILVAPLLLYGYLNFALATLFSALSLLAYLVFLYHELNNQNRFTKQLDCTQFAYELFKNLRDGYILEESYFVASYALRRNFNVMSLARFKTEHSFLYKWGIERYRSCLDQALTLDPKMRINHSKYAVTFEALNIDYHHLLSLVKIAKKHNNLYLYSYFLVNFFLGFALIMRFIYPIKGDMNFTLMIIFGLAKLIEIIFLYMRIYQNEVV